MLWRSWQRREELEKQNCKIQAVLIQYVFLLRKLFQHLYQNFHSFNELVAVNNLNMEFPVSMVNLLQAQSPLEGEFGLFSSQFTSTGAKSSSVEVDPPFSIDKSHQAS
ncbi:unnamed protein product [Prunus armeniaca]|uniref:Uncharacterized protein n=1 Tax=Prunus armeniaca TaxID=36596 RepID=A0A6J5TWX4_PRUAR|nr:unnamed protein product [Prunus armeniaca]